MAQEMKKFVGFIEFEDGRVIGPFRVGLKTKLQSTKSARANNWDEERDASQITSFMAWHAAKAAGLHDLSWDEYNEAVFDAQVVELEKDADVIGDDSEDPTQPAALAG
ncbi:hypothetical protein ACFY5D_18125 [Paeniglutamicibacter sp. NPDC012692]|uniref:hypothetical protein n=1 Tax=Paeniglutamicibacter sp. NPDC012692 TaxID=3364388 RepID=UPI0036C6F466